MKATFLKRLLHLKSLIRFLLLLMLGATTTVMLLSGYERFNLAAIRLDNTWVAETWRLINLNIGKREGYDGTQLEKKPSGGDVNLATPIIVEPNSLDNIYRQEDSGYDGKNQRGPAREEAGTGRPGNTQNDQITTKKTSHSEESLVTVKQEERNEPTTHHVLLVSSMGRSGSSFLGQILSSVPSAFYYFEPLYMLRNHLQEDMVWQGLMGLFTCNMSRKFLYAAVNRKNVLNSNKNLAHCSARCLKSGGLVKECRSKKVKVIKSIRTHVAWVAPLLNALPSLRVIHLVRDPRGTVRSMASLGWLQRYNLTTGCNKFSQDLLNGKTLTALYPDRFLSKHTASKNSRKPYDTHRNTSTMKEEWRSKITLEQLALSEAMCGGVITQLGYRLFNGSLEYTRNLSIPLFNINVNNKGLKEV
ncbi:hypothetical protein Pcinc_004947 [Petrolisthes cinctipes]|uniref:Sulfotransferase n=1 Tax=Petrolisthes cinctipes TaxID=88211 RepID=A0AAE1L111_PETCI|nr:hypothetical protein Pcinc_004947 [Petrolisthes cinctipes]